MKDMISIIGKDIRWIHYEINIFPSLPLNISRVFFTIVNSANGVGTRMNII